MPTVRKKMKTDAGHHVGDNQNSLTVGPRGPVDYEDFLLFEKMGHFNRERIPKRVVIGLGLESKSILASEGKAAAPDGMDRSLELSTPNSIAWIGKSRPRHPTKPPAKGPSTCKRVG